MGRLRAFRTLLTSDDCPPLSSLITQWRATSRPQRRPAVRAAVDGFLILTWPARAAMLSIRFTRRYGGQVARDTGKGVVRQLLEQARLAATKRLPAHFYYRYELYRASGDSGARFLPQREALRLFERLNRTRCEAVDDKLRFHELCLAHGLATPRVLGVARNGRLDCPAPAGGFFVKPITGSRGVGTRAWYGSSRRGWYSDRHGRQAPWAVIGQALERESKWRPLLVQELVSIHPSLDGLSPGALATLRVITGATPQGQVEFIAAAFRMPCHGHPHGIYSAMDPDTGRLHAADTCKPLTSALDRHPDTGASIGGTALPFWREAVAIAVRAHGHLPGYAFLGWDVALANGGPVLLEANAGWDVVSIERPHRRPLMETRFAAIKAMWEAR